LHASGNRCMNRWPTRQTTPRTQVRCRFSSGALRTWELHIYVTSSRHSNLDRIPTQPPPFVPCICPASVMAMGIRYVPPRRPRPANAPRNAPAMCTKYARMPVHYLRNQPLDRTTRRILGGAAASHLQLPVIGMWHKERKHTSVRRSRAGIHITYFCVTDIKVKALYIFTSSASKTTVFETF
jgi:hypothetical protein